MTQEDTKLKLQEKVNNTLGKKINNWQVTDFLGSGSFGDVWEVKDRKTHEIYALKIPLNKNGNNGEACLKKEAKIYKDILESSDSIKIARKNGIAWMKITTQNKENKKQTMMVMDILGPNLQHLLDKTQNKKLKLKTVTNLAILMIHTLKYVHDCDYIHRDLKPDNFCIAHETQNDNNRNLYLIDFGLAKRYRTKSGKHIKWSDDKGFCGTCRYASIAAHEGFEQSRKDDLESLGYILIYLYKGELPWQGIKENDKNKKYKLIGEMKKKMVLKDTDNGDDCKELCKNMPNEFKSYLRYTRDLKFDEVPQYGKLINMFKKLAISKDHYEKVPNFKVV